MPITAKDQQQLDEYHQEHKSTYGGVKEDYFALRYLTRRFERSESEMAPQVAFGGNDYGIDAWHLEKATGTLYLFQFKWSTDHRLFTKSMERIAADGIERIFGANDQDAKKNDVLENLRYELTEWRNAVKAVRILFVFKGDVEAAEANEGIQARRENIESKAYKITHYFDRDDLQLVVDFIADRPGRSGPPPKQSYPVRLVGTGTVTDGSRTLRVGFIPLIDLHRIHQALGPTFLDRNIRAGLSADNAPNRKLREAFHEIVIKGAEDPQVFAFRHNGVTLAADKVQENNDGLLLHTPRLLNGAQTVTTLGRFLAEHPGKSLPKDWTERLEGLHVLAKVIEAEPTSDFVTQVTIANNRQNPVQPWMLRAMDLRQVDLADRFREELKIYYSRQEGSFDTLSDEDREELGIESGKDIEIVRLAKTLLAIKGDLAGLLKIAEIFESQSKYDDTFKETLLQSCDLRTIVLAYKAGQFVTRVTNEMLERLPAKYHAGIRRMRNLTWALLIQGFLNDKKVEEYREEFGQDLVKQHQFAEVLLLMARTKLTLVVKDLYAHSQFTARIEEGRLDFLRTSDTFKVAMTKAKARFGWTRQSLV